MIEISRITDVMPLLEGVDGVIFDLDDTLFPEKQYVKSGYAKIAEAFGDESIAEKMWNVFLKGGRAIDEVIEEERRAEALKIYRFQMPEITLFDGVFEMLTAIKKQGKKLGIITDGRPEGQKNKIEALKIAPLFDEIIITDELGGVEFRKPCDKAFRIMCEKLKVDFYKAVYIGDNPKKDFIAPEKLGMKAVYFKNTAGLYSK